MTETPKLKKRIYSVSREFGDNLVLVDRNILENLITEIEDKIDELEAITDPHFMEEVYKRIDEIESGDVEGLSEEKILGLLKG
jgi:dephospho-CoA kinase